MTDLRAEAIRSCHLCLQACELCAASCLREPTVSKLVSCIQADLDCAEACRVTASLLASNSRFASDMARLCATICQECADICSMHDMEHCQACANACRNCVDACLLLTAA